ncbi:cobalt-precorrin-5B (C(1))-methyltransferase [Desulfopila aestuarii]|uniref:Cobalt-precorrin-5B C(1)-methyltransferase n=1 Tax=Desulfopila aestuarii DSM 18488 TaxID=1121416 RepID=A0A1M7Y119_9BACT|nr:cobalt-precorrin-5B (C(1))-methyltransferase [Desulfopila aestuarii]SHO45433.1 cobalt-precorrin-5B (C1)-methyltransferase [Desulfopila aestuarii DSM 18488]
MKKLRSGYTTGACAAAAAKGATLCLLSGHVVTEAEIPFPDGRRVRFAFDTCTPTVTGEQSCYVTVIKDAGDDPDVTNGAVIGASVTVIHEPSEKHPATITIVGGEGVGTVTKPGLAVQVGEPAINPVPRKMIQSAVLEAVEQCCGSSPIHLRVEIVVPEGRVLAAKTLNERLGIIGGISILGTTGIVRPVSAEAWTATITTAMEVAEATGNTEIVLSTGRTSEAALQQLCVFQPEAFIMMGDYLEFALKESAKYTFNRLHLAGMWAKIMKAALRIPQTHVRFGALEMEQAISLINKLGRTRNRDYLHGSNTARELYERLIDNNDQEIIRLVCEEARNYHQELSGKPVTVYLVHHNGRIEVQTEDEQ